MKIINNSTIQLGLQCTYSWHPKNVHLAFAQVRAFSVLAPACWHQLLVNNRVLWGLLQFLRACKSSSPRPLIELMYVQYTTILPYPPLLYSLMDEGWTRHGPAVEPVHSHWRVFYYQFSVPGVVFFLILFLFYFNDVFILLHIYCFLLPEPVCREGQVINCKTNKQTRLLFSFITHS